jgi:hypothetical protein
VYYKADILVEKERLLAIYDTILVLVYKLIKELKFIIVTKEIDFI